MIKESYHKMFSISLFINGITGLFISLNNIFWDIDALTIVCGIICMVNLFFLTFSSVKLYMMKDNKNGD